MFYSNLQNLANLDSSQNLNDSNTYKSCILWTPMYEDLKTKIPISLIGTNFPLIESELVSEIQLFKHKKIIALSIPKTGLYEINIISSLAMTAIAPSVFTTKEIASEITLPAQFKVGIYSQNETSTYVKKLLSSDEDRIRRFIPTQSPILKAGFSTSSFPTLTPGIGLIPTQNVFSCCIQLNAGDRIIPCVEVLHIGTKLEGVADDKAFIVGTNGSKISLDLLSSFKLKMMALSLKCVKLD